MSPDSQKAEELSEKLRPLGKAIAGAIETAPDWQEDWKIEAANAFYREFFKGAQAQQTQTPKFAQQ
ncbi:hypothetical protein [Paraflavitalea speifideaquila]|uniref:hypothetical protein n=1 Tax=Paraflavitalea speifideaquila TaxID=3076558 RepID=UPI0028E80E92|nr:hypothetical protein [Paraflavitalea speifideiaquila]